MAFDLNEVRYLTKYVVQETIPVNAPGPLEPLIVVNKANNIVYKWDTSTKAWRDMNIVDSLTATTFSATTATTTGLATTVLTITPQTATAASALTPVEGMIVVVSDTDGTFTSTGVWIYEGAAWAKITVV